MPPSGLTSSAAVRAPAAISTSAVRAPAAVILCFLVLSSLWAGCNPFSPALEDGNPFGDLLGDPTTVEGFFTNFRNAYELRDLSLYETLLDSSFVFVWHDFDAQVDREWGFGQDLETTRRLFQNSSSIRLQWNQIIAQDQLILFTQLRVVRSFNLTVTLEQGDVFRTDGNVNFTLNRADSLSTWRLQRWRDESEL